ncbi:hypothetical protein [Leptospira noguchii]|uniref:hypothetical protein n=1 Tax=Leptospira noguchii TaxID=28182 RepID=UPI000328410A|nr:hypothetical protein [Leptospira noguchii]EMS86422.1 hypothetical protein LEP1GSC074_2747 [Leptospira noguchii str. Hook]
MESFKDEILFEIGELEKNKTKDPMIVLKKIKAYDYGDLYHHKISKKYNPNWEDYNSFINDLYRKYLDAVFEILEKNGSEALKFLKDCKFYDQLGYIAALFADLDYKDVLPVLEEKMKAIKDPIVQEIFLEAITRLKSQTSMPESQNRMIWMFGNVSATQRILGASSDSVFLKKAQEKANVEDQLWEADQE